MVEPCQNVSVELERGKNIETISSIIKAIKIFQVEDMLLSVIFKILA